MARHMRVVSLGAGSEEHGSAESTRSSTTIERAT